MRIRALGIVGVFVFLCAGGLCPRLLASNPPAQQATAAISEPVVRVALYADEGSKRGGDNVEKCLGLEAGRFQCFRVTAEDIRNGALARADVLVQGGGSGSKQAKALRPEGCEAIRRFVKGGGGFLGICAGSYLASSYYPWSLHIINAKVIDREHWARGSGTVQLRFTQSGKARFALAEEVVACRYNQGPLLGPDDKADLPPYDALATFDTEIAKNGAPTGVMKGTTAIASSLFGRGRVVCISPHPEATEGLDNIVRHAVRWAAPQKKTGQP